MSGGNSTLNRQDLLKTTAALWLWCLPVVIILVTAGLYNDGRRLSFAVAGVLLSIATLWIGAACYANGRQCGRLHCKIDGILLPLLGVAGLVNVIGALSFTWAAYVNVLLGIVVLSFVAEYLDNKRHGKEQLNS
jgi:hypothetical protein